MAWLVSVLLGLFGAFGASVIASASDLDTIATRLEAHGFRCDVAAETMRNCINSGILADGKSYVVRVFTVEQRTADNITIFIQPADAADSDKVGAIYDYLASFFAYDKGKLKDRFPNAGSVEKWCNTAPNAVRYLDRCTVIEPISHNLRADISVSAPSNDNHLSLSWSVPRDK
jgi:hypothetical protein